MGHVTLVRHPCGLEQSQFSMQDGLLLDYDEARLSYRSPSEPGNSGSPVFHSDWQVIAVHHASRFDLPRSITQGGSYVANLAISLPAIDAGLRTRPPSAGGPAAEGGTRCQR